LVSLHLTPFRSCKFYLPFISIQCNLIELPFLLQYDNHIYPIEVKADQNITGKSLIQYEKFFQPACRIRYSMLNLKQDGNLINIPLFLADKTKELLKDKS